jgi:hypothetical protein
MRKEQINQNLKKELLGLNPRERLILSILFGWLLLHLVIFISTPNRRSGSMAESRASNHFWPFDGENATIGRTL